MDVATLEVLNRLRPWRAFWHESRDDPQRAYVTAIWPTTNAFRWFLRQNLAGLETRRAIVRRGERDLLIDPDELAKEAARLTGIDAPARNTRRARRS